MAAGEGQGQPRLDDRGVGGAAPYREVALAPPAMSPTRHIIARADGDQLVIEAKPHRSRLFNVSMLGGVAFIGNWVSQLTKGHLLFPAICMGVMALSYGADIISRAMSRTTLDLDGEHLWVRIRGPLRRTVGFGIRLSELAAPTVGSHRKALRTRHFLQLPGVTLPEGTNGELLEGHSPEHLAWVARQVADYLKKHRRESAGLGASRGPQPIGQEFGK